MLVARRKLVRVALVAAGAIVAALVVAQLALPAIAARIARDRIARYGTVRSVSVSAVPAIQLLWGSAQSARVVAGSLDMTEAQVDSLLPQLSGIERVRLTAESFQLGSFRLHRVRLEKHGQELSVEGVLEPSDLQAALPAGVHAQLLAGGDGGAEVLLGGSLFGFGVTVRASLGVAEGKLIAQPRGLPFAGLAQITVFSDPRLYVESLDVTGPSGGGGGSGEADGGSYRVQLGARLD